ncbi:MAG: PaaX domain-containing protein, C- domain protein, partial [Acidimicrobiales bacterium]
MSPVRNTRPLAARSVLASVLLGTDPPWLPTPLLVRTAALFGISEGAVRTALSRMVATGEAAVEDGGYRLAGRLVARQARQAASRR